MRIRQTSGFRKRLLKVVLLRSGSWKSFNGMNALRKGEQEKIEKKLQGGSMQRQSRAMQMHNGFMHVAAKKGGALKKTKRKRLNGIKKPQKMNVVRQNTVWVFAINMG